MRLKPGRARIRVHPLALMFPLAVAMLESGTEAVALLAGLAIHEAGHVLSARCLGVEISQLRLMPFGGALYMDNPYALSPMRLLAIAIAGPLSNLLALFAGAALAHWQMLAPTMALQMSRINLALMLFNLLPALPLDGGRALYALLYRRLGASRAVEVGIWAGRAVAALLIVAAGWAALSGNPLNLCNLFSAVFILASAPQERVALTGARVKSMLNGLKPLAKPMPAQVWAVGADCRIRDALRPARSDVLTLYAVYKDSRLASFTDDRRLLEAALDRGDSTAIGDIC